MNSSLTITMYAMCVVFVVTTFPAPVLVTIYTISELLGTDLMKTQNALFEITLRLSLINHSINFLLYCLTGSVFRKALSQVCCKVRITSRQIEEQCPTVEAQV